MVTVAVQLAVTNGNTSYDDKTDENGCKKETAHDFNKALFDFDRGRVDTGLKESTNAGNVYRCLFFIVLY